MSKIGDRRKKNGGRRPGAGRPRLHLSSHVWVYTPEGKVDLIEYCKAVGYDPVVSMIEIAEDEDNSATVRLSAHREIAKYIHATLGQIKMEHSGSIQGDLAEKSIEDLKRIADELRSNTGADPD